MLTAHLDTKSAVSCAKFGPSTLMGGAARVERAVMPKVRMDTGLLRGKPPRRVVLEERIQQISCRAAEARNQRSRRPFPFRKRGFIIGKRSDIRPILFGGCTQGTSEPIVSLSSLPIERIILA